MKNSGSHSELSIEKAVGQYVVYHDVMSKVEPERDLYLAVSEAVFVSLFEEPIGRLLLDNHRVRLVVFDPQKEMIRQWAP